MKEIKAFVRPSMLDSVIDALAARPEILGITVTNVKGYGHGEGGTPAEALDYNKMEIVVSQDHVELVTGILMENARTGVVGDGKIFISDVEQAIRIRTGERGEIAVHQRPS
ncbi:MAG: P-II family nitrogen regulator [Rhodothermia bacterium]|nr:MAG: P-II family nitrogen regulator [Rhodothermia bacterium]